MSFPRFFVAAALGLAAVGCIQLYRMDVQQGNVLTQEMVDKLKPGMTRSQVRFVLGTPLVTDAFHPNRWDYFYQLHKGIERTTERRRLTVVFDGDNLIRLEGDLVPKVESGAPIAAPQPPTGTEPLGPPISGDAPARDALPWDRREAVDKSLSDRRRAPDRASL